MRCHDAGAAATVALKFGYQYSQDRGPRTYTSMNKRVTNLPTQLGGAADLSIQVGLRPILRAGISATAGLASWTAASGTLLGKAVHDTQSSRSIMTCI